MIQRLLHFLDASPVNFLAVRNIAHELEAHGFRRIDAASPLGHLSAGDRFFVTKNDSSIYAFRIGRKPLADQGFHMICAHSDSPTFRIKPNAEMTGEGGIVRLNTEVYGGPILSTWMDRPLTIAGRVITRGEDAFSSVTHLIHIRRTATVTRDDIIDFDLYLADTTPACTFGAHDELISSGRLDDLSMCYAGLEALTAAHDSDTTQVLAIFDNEETGSQTKQGAGSPFLSYLLQRIALAQSGTAEAYYQAVERAFMISADNAHAFHPNYAEKYDPTNHPMLGGGPVIKFNAAQKYASDAVTAAVFAELCRKAGVPCQRFVNHSEVAGGSTLGNILASSIPLRGVDMGNAILAMHSCRETGSVADHEYCVKVFTTFYNE